MKNFLAWLLRPAINTILDERADREAEAKAFGLPTAIGEPEPITHQEVIMRKNEFLRMMGVPFEQ